MTGDVAPVILPADDALELIEILEFLGDFFAAEPGVLGASLARFTGGLPDLDELRGDLARFAFVLGGDGEQFVFGAAR